MAENKISPLAIGAAIVAGVGGLAALVVLGGDPASGRAGSAPADSAGTATPPPVVPQPPQAPGADPTNPAGGAPAIPEAPNARPQAAGAPRSAAGVGAPDRMQPQTPTANVVAFDDESLSFEARMPGGAAGDPVIGYLQKDSEGYLRRIRFNARTDYDRARAEGRTPDQWEVRVAWAYSARAGDYVSLIGEASEYTGGVAQPNLLFDSHIANAKTGEEVDLVEMFKPPFSPSPAAVAATCEALKVAKRARIRSETFYEEPILCVGPRSNIRLDQARIALAPSNVADRFGGLYIYYAPDVVGPPSEGEYRLLVQQEVFAEDLRPAFRALFAGTAPELP